MLVYLYAPAPRMDTGYPVLKLYPAPPPKKSWRFRGQKNKKSPLKTVVSDI